ncbi:uncharacterized protein [Clytia hemisphaerica]|uniref:RING-type domain-containing protein n=1 Tax=Clytia hemisphaerica TaxID=252671 RepID=A0A7M5USU4_9CNID
MACNKQNGKSKKNPTAHKTIPTGFQFEIAGTERKEFECPICLCIMRNATELPCEHLMCQDCLEYFEQEKVACAKRNGQAKFQCSVCMTPYKKDDKKAVRSVDRIIQTTVFVKCLQSGCDWIGCIQDQPEHDRKCRSVRMQCPYHSIGCLARFKQGELTEHIKTNQENHCMLVLIVVNGLAKEKEKYCQKIADQNKKLESYQCFETLLQGNIKRLDVLERDNLELKSKLGNYEKLANENASIFQRLESLEQKYDALLKAVAFSNPARLQNLVAENKALSQTVSELKKMVQNQPSDVNLDVGRCKRLLLESSKHAKRLNALESENKELKKIAKEQKNEITTLTEDLDHLKKDVSREQKRVNSEFADFNRLIESMTGEVAYLEEDIVGLTSFAEKVSKLHLQLSDKQLWEASSVIQFLKKKHYDSHATVQKWDKLSDDIRYDLSTIKVEDTSYLDTLQQAVSSYKETIFPHAWNARIKKLFDFLPYGYLVGAYVKVACGPLNHIKVDVYRSVVEFNLETSKEKYHKHSSLVASYRHYSEDCLHVAFYHYRAIESLRLLNWDDEVKSKKLMPGKMVNLDDQFSGYGCVILEMSRK